MASRVRPPAAIPLALRDAIFVAVGAGLIGIGVNAVRPGGIPFIANEAYEILVPCPEPGGEVYPLPPDALEIAAPETFRVDARAADAFNAWSAPDAINLPYDYLDPTPPERLQALARNIARSRAQRVVVFGDGDRPDSGEQLGKEISGFGIKNVHFVEGGAPALRAAQSWEASR